MVWRIIQVLYTTTRYVVVKGIHWHCTVDGVVIDKTGVYNVCKMKCGWSPVCESYSRLRHLYNVWL